MVHLLSKQCIQIYRNGIMQASSVLQEQFIRNISFSSFFGKSPDGLTEGSSYTCERRFTKDDVFRYSGLSEDSNPIHTNEIAAKNAGFSGCVIHGMLTAGLFPAIIGSNFPGAIYVSQTLKFHEPVLVDEDLFAEVIVKDISVLRRHHKVTFSTTCYKKEASVIAVDGMAVALLPVK